jgi:hypothetical protein
MRSRIRTPIALISLATFLGGSLGLAPALAQPLEIVDANGTKIGSNVIGADQEQRLRVAFNFDGRVFTLLVTQSDFLSDFTLLFQSPDCTGNQFVIDNSILSGTPSLVASVAVAPPGKTVYLPVLNSSSQSITVGSTLSSDGTCSPVTPFEAPVFPAQGIADLSTQFMPPFRVQFVLPPQ